MSPSSAGVLAAAVAIFLAAASLSRAYVASDRPLQLLAALALYCVGNLLMVRVMREQGLGLAISLTSVVQLVLVNIVAVAVFGERPAPAQLAGIALGLVSVALLAMPSQGR